MPMAKIKARLSKTAPPAFVMKGILNTSGAPRRSSNAAAGRTAMGSISALPMLCNFSSIPLMVNPSLSQKL